MTNNFHTIGIHIANTSPYKRLDKMQKCRFGREEAMLTAAYATVLALFVFGLPFLMGE